MGRRAYGVDVAGLGAASDWRCWVCGGEVDRAGPAGAPAAPTVDHVVPRARGGTSDPANLRLAHRRCNGARGSALPELAWPADVGVLDPAPLWPVVQRARRRPGEWEVVGVAAGDAAARAEAWLGETVPWLLGGQWEVRRSALGAGDLETLALRATGPRRDRRRTRR